MYSYLGTVIVCFIGKVQVYVDCHNRRIAVLFELYVSRCCVGSFAGFGLVANCEGIVVDIIATAGGCGGFGIRKLS